MHIQYSRPVSECCIFGENAFGKFYAVGSRIAVGENKAEKLYTN